MMSKKQSINGQKFTVSAASSGPHANRTLLTELSTWASSLTFTFEEGVNMICSFENFGKMCKQHSLSSKKYQKCDSKV